MDFEENLPLSEAVFFILLSLLPGPKHGYAIMKDVEDLSDSRVNLSTGTLYGALKRLLKAGWVQRVEDEGDESGRERKDYSLTQLGRGILQAEKDRMQSLVMLTQKRSSERGIS
ncbi:MAG: helix-turn-helix transcriptional regulator [Anaerolineales bacterium]|jgi:DNA-binding PadR family transcriptional regulator